jgi:hypothetical protein
MKKQLLLVLAILFQLAAFSQQTDKKDVIIKTNGDELSGSVKAIDDSTIQFVYAGEQLVYKLKKSEILKITFASGRVEKFNVAGAPPAAGASTAVASQPVASKEERRNKIAILPFGYISEVDPSTATEMGMRIQEECRDFLVKNAGLYTLVENRLIDSKLAKAGITRANILTYSVDDLCEMLGAEFIIDGLVNITKTAQTTYGSQSVSGEVKDKDKDKTDGDKKVSGYSSNYSTTTQNFSTQVTLKAYNDKGETVFSENRKPFFGGVKDSYKSAMEYLLKRTPFYQK